ncbi:hypothetical protein [Halobacillus sp. A5]|uniref:hypothetical protein n=1 Tax=Halobacillus sp. A5 TaxID=2880263 RepID=UPI0020A65F0C|nr:hypothetical protein [Halobacillus sp. A5]MCP3025773.1 hypothetical protein [Halobacillus sp. A5]
MNKNEVEKRIIEKYRQDEDMMILLFAQWCRNNNMDPLQVYKEAYPDQPQNVKLEIAIDAVVPKEQSDEISTAALFEILSIFDNDELAFKINEYIVYNHKYSSK